MKVISLLQPWATLVVIGAKKIETRSWNTKYRGKILIHASQKFTKEQERLAFELSQLLKDSRIYHCHRGAIIGQASLAETFQFGGVRSIEYVNSCPKGDMKLEMMLGDWNEGRWGWRLESPIEYPIQIPAKGQLGIWEYEMPDKIGYNMNGAHASFDGMPDQKTVDAVEELIDKAKKIRCNVH